MRNQVQKGLTQSVKSPGNSSIPSKYQPAHISNAERKGFSSQTKRFIHSENENPSPATYLSHTPADTSSPSFSKKGTGGMASESSRMSCRPQNVLPGPDAYSMHGSLLRQHDFNRGVSRNFQHPIAVQTTDVHRRIPAPNQYNVRYSSVERKFVISAKSVFLSQTSRSALSASKGLSPCHYNVDDAAIRVIPKTHSSCFKSTSVRIQPLMMSQGPGPGTYDPYTAPEPVKRTLLPRRHYLALSAPALIPPKDPPLPGPGHYDVANYTESQKNVMASASFASGTSRWTQDVRGQDVPGPGTYDPNLLSKKSFLQSPFKMWKPPA